MNPRFELSPDAELRPFAIVGPSAAALALGDVRAVDALDAAQADFCGAMNRANCLAYDGTPQPGSETTALGMPPWVMLDCCILPAAVFGFEVRREHVPLPLADALDPGGALEWVGISEYIALPSVELGTVVGVSLFALASGRGLGTRTKAMALRSLSATSQVGVTQWASPGVRLHLRFGPLRVVSPAVAVHNRPTETFVYRLDVPASPRLDAMAAGEAAPPVKPVTADISVDPRTEDVPALVRRAAGAVWVVGTGPVEDGELTRLDLVVSDE